MKRILVLGAGMVAGAHVRYLLDQPDFHVTVASRTLSKAQAIIQGHPRGTALQLDSNDTAAMENLIRQADLAVSLLPYRYHPVVAQLCIKHSKPMVTASYVKEAMARLDQPAKASGVILLNEVGVDPGIDHMSAMRVIHKVQREGGEITGFASWCGGLPAPEANTNPLGYKFSWSPRGVLLAGKNPARYLRDGQEVVIPGAELFDHHWTVPVEIEGRVTDFEGYPNRDSLPYMQTYGITTARDMFRGTLRNGGWCQTMRAIADLGWLDESPRDDIAGLTFAQLTARLIGASSETPHSKGDLKKTIVDRLKIEEDSQTMRNLEWLGLLGDNPLPLQGKSPIDILTAHMLDVMSYAPGERDMLIMQHQFRAQYPDRAEKITATMVEFGIPYGDSAMARTVGLPAAVAAKLILQGKIKLTGVHIPVIPEIYEPILADLETLGIKVAETWETLRDL